MRPVLVVMGLVLAQDLPQMGLIPDDVPEQRAVPRQILPNSCHRRM
jgi:hypothetical protein